VWVANTGGTSLTRVDTASLATQDLPLEDRPAAVVSAYGRLWAVEMDGSVQVFRANGTADDIESPPVAGDARAGGESHGVWFVGNGARLTRIDPRREVARTVGAQREYARPAPPKPLSGEPSDLVATDDSIWVACGRTLWRLDTTGNGRVIATVTFPRAVGRLALGSGELFAAVPGLKRIYRVRF
jgi:hypothetical protein